MNTTLRIGDIISWRDNNGKGKQHEGKLTSIGCVTFYVNLGRDGCGPETRVFQENHPKLVERPSI